jgi:hypothetical protein
VKFGLEPIANVAPYKRISINDPVPADTNVRPPTTAEICENLMKQHEANRVWALVKGAAEGTNITAREYEAPAEDMA